MPRNDNRDPFLVSENGKRARERDRFANARAVLRAKREAHWAEQAVEQPATRSAPVPPADAVALYRAERDKRLQAGKPVLPSRAS